MPKTKRVPPIFLNVYAHGCVYGRKCVHFRRYMCECRYTSTCPNILPNTFSKGINLIKFHPTKNQTTLPPPPILLNVYACVRKCALLGGILGVLVFVPTSYLPKNLKTTTGSNIIPFQSIEINWCQPLPQLLKYQRTQTS